MYIMHIHKGIIDFMEQFLSKYNFPALNYHSDRRNYSCQLIYVYSYRSILFQTFLYSRDFAAASVFFRSDVLCYCSKDSCENIIIQLYISAALRYFIRYQRFPLQLMQFCEDKPSQSPSRVSRFRKYSISNEIL